VDWGTIAPAAITALVGLAGIGGTLLSARMTGRSEDKRAKLAEKRRIYANFLAAHSAALRESVLEARAGSSPARKDYAVLHDNAVVAQMAALNAAAEVQLISSFNVARLAMESFGTLVDISPASPGHEEWAKAYALLVAAMRTELGEALE
jgi:hypothetical protein